MKKSFAFRGTDSLRRARGLTLIEIVVVLAILIALAGLLLSRFSGTISSADSGAEGVTQVQLFTNFAQFYSLNNVWPNQLDSLLSPSGSTWTPYPYLQSNLLSPGGLQRLTMTDTGNAGLTGGQVTSLANGGLLAVMDQALPTGSTPPPTPSDSGTLLRPLAAGQPVAWLNPASVDGQRIIKTFYPHYFDPVPIPNPAVVQLAVFGVGPQCTAVQGGSSSTAMPTLMSAPLAPGAGANGAFYRRFLAVYAVYATGSRATLLGVLDATGQVAGQNLTNANPSASP